MRRRALSLGDVVEILDASYLDDGYGMNTGFNPVGMITRLNDNFIWVAPVEEDEYSNKLLIVGPEVIIRREQAHYLD